MKAASFFLFLIIFSCSSPSEEKLSIAVSANMSATAQELQKTFEQETGIACELIISSSGKITSQIMAGAPYDIFLAADMKYPQVLFENGFSEQAPKTYAKGQLVLWSMKLKKPLEELKSAENLAIANPETAPYGRAAKQVLEHLHISKDNLIYGESIAQTNQFIETGAVSLGFTSLSTVLSKELKGKGFWSLVPDSLYSPIYQGIAIIGEVDSSQEMFNEFMFTSKAKDILKSYGYRVNE